ncbi:hypothetical protein CM49_03011 [Paenibacillus sp. P1XP2]|nr:hypothetical protein CM49_03011 [Paenibacillus sp. P1XP2]
MVRIHGAVAQHVTVKYLDKETNKALAEPTDVTGLKGKQIELEAKKVLGYTPEKVSDKYTFTGKEGQEYTFYYTADKQTVTVKYLERGTDKELKAPATEEGVTDKTITIVAPAIPGYAPEQPSLTYKFTAEKNQEVVLYYNATEQQVTVQHLVEARTKNWFSQRSKAAILARKSTLLWRFQATRRSKEPRRIRSTGMKSNPIPCIIQPISKR